MRKLKERNKRFWTFVLALIVAASILPLDFAVWAAEDSEFESEDVIEDMESSDSMESPGDSDEIEIIEDSVIEDDTSVGVDESDSPEDYEDDEVLEESEEIEEAEEYEPDSLYESTGSVYLHTHIYYVDQALELTFPNPDTVTDSEENADPTLESSTVSAETALKDNLQHYEFDGWYRTSTLGSLGDEEEKFKTLQSANVQLAGSGYVEQSMTDDGKPVIGSYTFKRADDYEDGENYYFYGRYLPKYDINYAIWVDGVTDFSDNPAVEMRLFPNTYTYGTGVASSELKSPDKMEGVNQNALPDSNKYDFVGWYTMAGSDSTDMQKAESISSTTHGDVTLYARYSPVYSITYYDEENKVITPEASWKWPTSYRSDGTVNLPSLPTKNGYTPVGWFKSSVRAASDQLESINAGATGDIELFAKYDPQKYTLVFRYESEEGSIIPCADLSYNEEQLRFEGDYASTQYTIEDAITLPTPTSKSGWSFLGWYNTDGSTAANIVRGTTGAKTFIAKFKYTILYEDSNGTTYNASQYGWPETYTYADAVTLPTLPTAQTGYEADGWHDNINGTGTAIAKIPVHSTGQKVFYSKYKLIEYQLNFKNAEGDSVGLDPITITASSSTVDLTNIIPTRIPDHAKEFVAWYYNDDFWGDPVTSVNINYFDSSKKLTLYAKFEYEKYYITYKDADGVTYDATQYGWPETYTYNDEVVLPTLPTASIGYKKDGWYNNKNGTGTAIELIPLHSTGNLIFYSKYTPIEYRIAFWSSDIDVGLDPMTLTINSFPVDMTNKKPTSIPEHATFVGWYNNENYTGSPAASVIVDDFGSSRTLTLYAKFEYEKYSITYMDPSGHAYDASQYGWPTEYTYTESITLPSLPTAPTGYEPDGWYQYNTELSAWEKIVRMAYDETGDKVYHASYEAILYHTELNSEFGGEALVTSREDTVDSLPIDLTADALSEMIQSREYFKGWYDNEDFTGSAYTTVNINNFNADCELRLYAKYEVPITYSLDGGTNASNNPNTFVSGKGISGFANATKSGFDFLGWFDKTNFAYDANAITSISSSETKSQTLYAWFAKKNETKIGITYNLDGGKLVSSAPSTYTYGTTTTLPSATKEDYTFKGWKDDATGQTITSISSTEFKEMHLTATYEKDTPEPTPDPTPVYYTVDYHYYKDGVESTKSERYAAGSSVSFNPEQVSGYQFDGWYPVSNFSKDSFLSDSWTGTKATSVSSSLTLYGRYIPVTNKITYELNGGTNSSKNPTSYTYGTGVSAFEAAEKAGYEFAGWVDASGTAVTAIPTTAFGDKSLTATYKGSDLKNAEITLAKTVYDGKTHTATVSKVVINGRTLTSGTDYTVTSASGKNVGKYSVTVKGAGDYAGTSKTTEYQITACPMKNVKIKLSKGTFKYNGSSQKPTLTVTCNGTTLSSSDYTATYPKNTTSVGLKNIKVSAKGSNFTGNKPALYYIKKGATSFTAKASSATIDYKKLKKENQTITIKITKLSTGSSACTFAIHAVSKKSQKGNVSVDKNGKVTVKKGSKKCKIVVYITSKENSVRKAKTKKVTLQIK
ncbi:MAG: InlB B-repeat-containing protein [Lachnospiraceae bacterium]|nr:InlB B-repeat-containing protein [Lachnospiraceae bacterium]